MRQRATLGLSQKEAAARIGVGEGTMARWERGDGEPAGAALAPAERFLAGGESKRLAG